VYLLRALLRVTFFAGTSFFILFLSGCAGGGSDPSVRKISGTHTTKYFYRRISSTSTGREVKDYLLCTRYTVTRDRDGAVMATYDAGCQYVSGGYDQVTEVPPPGNGTVTQVIDCNSNPTDPICAQLIASVNNSPSSKGCTNQDQSAGTAYAGIGPDSSLFGIPPAGDQGSEAFGWIYKNSSTGIFKYDQPSVSGLDANGHATLPTWTSYPGWELAGYYHTHPYDPGLGGNQTSNGSHFSSQDLSNLFPNEVVYVAVRDTDSGDSGGGGLATRFYSFNNSTHTESLVARVGSGGC